MEKIADTIKGSFPEKICSDCGKKGCLFIHWGPLVPSGESGTFCPLCMSFRQSVNMKKPLGVKPPGEAEEFKNSSLKIETENGSIYRLMEPNKEGLRKIYCDNRELGFVLCKILLLKIGKSLCVWQYNIENRSNVWQTSRVTKTEKV